MNRSDKEIERVAKEPLKDLTLLFVEDDPTTRTMIKEILGERVKAFFSAESAEEGWELFEKEHPDLVLTDVRLPGMDGLTMAARMKESDPGLPVIVMSAFDQRETLLRAIEVGIDGFLPKPIDIAQLFRQCEKTASQLQKIRFAEKEQYARLQELERKAHHDTVTRLPNRHRFEEDLDRTIEESAQEGKSAGLFLIDLDDFKQINDRYGHPAGDEALRILAGRINSTVKERGILYRIGGDEFALLTEKLSSSAELLPLADALQKLSSFTLRFDNQPIEIQCSIGVCSYPDAASNRLELLRKADQALYRAKEEGKGVYRICR